MPRAFGPLSRRTFLALAASGAAAALVPGRLLVPGAFAEELVRTPRLMPGPFFPDRLPLDTDNDLLIVNDSITPAIGTITHLAGRVLDSGGSPVRNALVEIWQVDSLGSYLHSDGRPTGKRDGNFQGYGRFLTGSAGEYYFRTVKPVPYPGRTPHIHVKVGIRGQRPFVTQCFIRGEPGNTEDFVLNDIEDPREREALLADFTPVEDSRIGELSAVFDIVLGITPGRPA